MAKYRFEQIAINSTEKKKPVEEDRFTYLGLEHLDSGSLKVTRFGSEVAPIGEKLVMHKGDVLFGKRRAYQKKVAIAPFDGIFSAHGMVLRPREDVIDKSFFPLFISSDYFLDAAIKISVGSLSPTINWRDLKTLEFELPDLATQRKLAETLWSINDTMETYKKLIAATDELVKSQFMELFGDPVTNTQGREVRPFKDFMLDIRYGTSQPPTFNELGEFKFIRATNIKAGRITENGMLRISADEAAKIEKCRLNGNEIIIVRSGANTGDTCVVTDEYRDQYAGYDIIVTLNLEIANPVFFNELMNTHYMQAIIKPLTVRAAQPHINSEQVQNLPMLVVPLQEQEQFATFVRQSDKSTIRNMLETINKPECQISTEDLRGYLDTYQRRGTVSKVTLDNVRRILSSFFAWLEDEDYIVKSPVRRIHKVKTGKTVKETYSDEALELMRDHCDNTRDLAMIDLLTSTGIRVGELVKLNRSDLDFENRECIVFGKGNKQRKVYFDARTKIHLQRYLSERRDGNESLFVSLLKPYERLQISGVEIRLRKIGRELNFNKVHPHKFRRTLATMAIDKGMPIEQVQQLLGHQSIDTTLQYAMVNQNNVKESHRKYIG